MQQKDAGILGNIYFANLCNVRTKFLLHISDNTMRINNSCRWGHPLMRNLLGRPHATVLRYLDHCSVTVQKPFLKDEVPSVIPSLPDQSEPTEAQVFNFGSLAKFSRKHSNRCRVSHVIS